MNIVIKVPIDVVFFFSHKSQYISKSKLCVSIDVQFFLCASFCMSNVKKLAKNLSQIHTAVGDRRP
jgi:hypothetical protein